MYKIFIIGNSNSIWTREYVRNIHDNNANEIFITAYDPLTNDAEQDYNGMGVKVVNLYSHNKYLNKISKAIKLAKFLIFDCKKLKMDYIDLQSPPHNFQATIIYHLLKKTKSNVIIEFWGSDIMRVGSSGASRMYPLMKIAKYINVSTEEIANKFESHYGKEFSHKYVSAKFGSLAFSEIKKNVESNDSKGYKSEFGLSEDKITIAIGHNGNVEQQHVAVLDELKKINEDLKTKIQLLIHLGYGASKEYVADVAKCAEECGISTVILEQLYDLKTIAKLRLSTDIMIHAQTTDALSGSIRECLYAGAILLNPSWISYDEFDQLGISYVKYSEFNEITPLLEDVLLDNKKIDISGNKKALEDAFSWDAVRKDWKRIFNERTS